MNFIGLKLLNRTNQNISITLDHVPYCLLCIIYYEDLLCSKAIGFLRCTSLSRWSSHHVSLSFPIIIPSVTLLYSHVFFHLFLFHLHLFFHHFLLLLVHIHIHCYWDTFNQSKHHTTYHCISESRLWSTSDL